MKSAVRGVARCASALACAYAAAAVSLCVAAPREVDDLNALRSRIGALKTELDKKEATRRESRDALRESERAISDANRALRALEAASRGAQEELGELKRRRQGLGESVARQQAALGRMLAARYAAGPPDILRIALSGNDPNEAARSLVYLAALSGAVARLIGDFRADAAELDGIAETVREKAARLETIESEKRDERKKILAETNERKRLLARLAGDIRNSRREIRNLRGDESRLARIVEEIGKVLLKAPGAGYVAARRKGVITERLPEKSADGAGSGLFSSLRGKLRLPVRGELVARFGSPRNEGRSASKGVFIRTTEGQTVRSVAPGRVVFADWMRGFGNLLIVDHGEAYMSVYGNNEALLKQPGDTVSVGDPIATVGSTGGSAETGLYFELRHLGKAFDPLSWSDLN